MLRELPELQVVNLAGNPTCKDSEYRNFCLAYLKHLRYFDYALLVESEVTAVRTVLVFAIGYGYGFGINKFAIHIQRFVFWLAFASATMLFGRCFSVCC